MFYFATNKARAHTCIRPVTANLDVFTITRPQATSQLNDDEYNELRNYVTIPSYQKAVGGEYQALLGSYHPFLKAQSFHRQPALFAGVPVVTIHSHSHEGFQTMYKLGSEAGDGSQADRDAFKDLLPTWEKDVTASQKQFLSLTDPENRHSLVAREGAGHCVQMQDKESCLAALKWVMTKSKAGDLSSSSSARKEGSESDK